MSSDKLERSELALDPAAFADDAPLLVLDTEEQQRELRASLLESIAPIAERWRRIRAESMEMGRQIFIP